MEKTQEAFSLLFLLSALSSGMAAGSVAYALGRVHYPRWLPEPLSLSQRVYIHKHWVHTHCAKHMVNCLWGIAYRLQPFHAYCHKTDAYFSSTVASQLSVVVVPGTITA